MFEHEVNHHLKDLNLDLFLQLVKNSEKSVFYYTPFINEWIPKDEIKKTIKDIQFNSEIIDQVNHFIEKNNLNYEYEGIHLRMTDNEYLFNHKDLSYLEEEIRKQSNKKFFVCSDNPETEKIFSRFPNTFSFYKKYKTEKLFPNFDWRMDDTPFKNQDGIDTVYNVERSVEHCKETAVDFLLLSYSNHFYISHYSTFSNLSKIVGESLKENKRNKTMKYYYWITFDYHWEDITKMVDENYAHEYDSNDVLVLAVHHHQTIEQIKENNPDHKKIIIYQLEPLVDNHWWSKDYIVSRLRGADEVWDYDLDNIEILKSYGIDAKFKPFKYTESLKTSKNVENPDIDVFFYGTLTEHRSKILEIITNCGLIGRTTAWSYGLSKEMLDEFIGRSKIVLDLQDNYKFNKKPEGYIQKQSRIYYLLINNKCVVSEKSKKNYFDNLITECDQNDLKDTIDYLLENDRWKYFSDVSEQFRKLSEKQLIHRSLNQKNKIAIFYHLYQAKNWKKIFQEQMSSLIESGLYDNCDFIHIGINGDEELPFTLDKMRVEYNENKILEANTLQRAWEFSNNNQDYKILYFHSKGVTWSDHPYYSVTTTSWRKYLEYFVIKNWKTCIGDLNSYDCVGAEWIYKAKLTDLDLQKDTYLIVPHYNGNFWWASAKYLSQLDLDYIYNEEKGWARFKSEFWMGTKKPKFKSYHNSYKLLYQFNYTPDYYTKDVTNE